MSSSGPFHEGYNDYKGTKRGQAKYPLEDLQTKEHEGEMVKAALQRAEEERRRAASQSRFDGLRVLLFKYDYRAFPPQDHMRLPGQLSGSGLIGCRQVEKTTLAKLLASSRSPDAVHLDIELPSGG